MNSITIRDVLDAAGGPAPEHANLPGDRGTVRIAYTHAGFGGRRAWMLCPVCSRRVRILYLIPRPCCRGCAGIPYAARGLHRNRDWESWGRIAARLARVRKRLARRYLRLAERGRLERLEVELVDQLREVLLETIAVHGEQVLRRGTQ